MTLNIDEHKTTTVTDLDAVQRCTRMLADHLAIRLAIPPETIDVDAPVFGVEGGVIGPVALDSMELVEMLVDLEEHLGVSILQRFDALADLSIAAIAAIATDAVAGAKPYGRA